LGGVLAEKDVAAKFFKTAGVSFEATGRVTASVLETLVADIVGFVN